ncbi:MAG: hypothetical protein JSS27_16025 [Planctomycetes bacterium]|nr:hypothetical protein [Planctomycetota bacterium]
MKQIIFTLVVLCATAQVASAQYYRPYRHGYRGYGGYGYATSPMQGMAYGAAAMTAAQGQANLANAQAAQAQQQAYQMALDNKLKATETYFEMRRVNREAQKAEHDARYPAQMYGSPSLAPKPVQLSATQLDPVTGSIAWTPLLMSPEYASYREPIDGFFRKRAEHLSTGGPSAISDLRRASSAMMDQLNKNINNIKPQDWVDAKRLLDALMQTANMPA